MDDSESKRGSVTQLHPSGDEQATLYDINQRDVEMTGELAHSRHIEHHIVFLLIN